ncbi:MAG TPA: hypothetical protein PKD90_04270 [Phnomibacter sp.]|nr:hypothetical protein [Phnomibacter sp.]
MFTKTDAEAYFMAEKQAGLLFLIIGLLAVAGAAYLWWLAKWPWAKGMAIPLTIIAVLQAVVGYTVHSRADAQRKNVVYNMDLNPEAIRQQELPRMQTVMKNFTLYKWVEMILLLTGLGLCLYFRQKPEGQFWLGVGMGLLLQSCLMLAADYFAERRGRNYFTGLSHWARQPG